MLHLVVADLDSPGKQSLCLVQETDCITEMNDRRVESMPIIGHRYHLLFAMFHNMPNVIHLPRTDYHMESQQRSRMI
jgi:hypothetical protein